MAATAHWTAAADFPGNGSPRDKLGFAVKVATIISTGQRVQPWQFHLADRFVELSADNPSAVHDLDSDEREAMIHCGTALQHLKLALKRHRCFGRVELFPNLDQPTLAARVHPGSNGARDDYERQLSEALEVGEKDSLRRELPDNMVALDVVSRALPGDRGWLEFARSENSRQRLLALLNSPGRAQLKEIRLQNETLVRSIDGAWESTRATSTTFVPPGIGQRLARPARSKNKSAFTKPISRNSRRSMPLTKYSVDGGPMMPKRCISPC